MNKKYFIGILILLFVWIGIDRFINIDPFISKDGLTLITISDSLWTNAPEGKLFQLDNKYKPLQSFVYTENYNSIFRTYNDYCKIETHYQFKNEYGEPRMFRIMESDKSIDYSSIDLPTQEFINGMHVSYGIMNKPDHISEDVANALFAIKIENNQYVVILQFEREDLKELKPTLYKIFE